MKGLKMETYTTIQGDMWDGIAKKVYGTESGMNALLKANMQYRSTVIFSAGIILSVPEYTALVTDKLPPWRR